jgi:hypothetical protein
MAKTVSTILGAGFLLVGLLGFVVPGFLGAHLSMAHNVVHIVSGALALYFGLKGTLASARLFCLVFGAVYALLGVVGFLAGSPGSPSAGIHGTSPDDRMFKLLPGVLELGTPDHLIHIVLGAAFLAGGFLTKASLAKAVD